MIIDPNTIARSHIADALELHRYPLARLVMSGNSVEMPFLSQSPQWGASVENRYAPRSSQWRSGYHSRVVPALRPSN
jgi:hypothetical protein